MAYKRSIDDLDRRDWVVEPERSQKLIEAISPYWQNVGRRLGIKDYTLTQVRKDNLSDGQRGMCYEMVRIWKDRNSSKATYGVLAKALEEEQLRALAENLLDGMFDYDTAAASTEKSSTPASLKVAVPQAGNKPSQKAATPHTVPSTAVPPPAVLLPHYKMGNKPRGMCLILTYGKFDGNQHSPLPGIKRDMENIRKTFETLGYDVESYRNLDKNNSMYYIEDMAKQTADSFVLFVSSHGNEKSFFTRDNQEIALQDVITPFNADICPGFAGKPKMFFFNSCRGGAKDRMVKLAPSAPGLLDKGVGANISYYRPTQADFCVVLSAVSGYACWHDLNEGSIFVRSITNTLTQNYEKHHLIDMFTMSNDTLLREFEEERKSSGNPDSICQVPTIISTLSKAVYFVDE